MRIVPVTTPTRRRARLAAYRFFGGPIQSVYKRRDCARGGPILPMGVVPFRCLVYVVAVPGVGPLVPLNASFFDVGIGLNDYERHIWRLTGTWQSHRDCWAHFPDTVSVVSFH